MKDVPKKWCPYCRVNIPYSRDAIRDHEDSRKHQLNKERQLKHQQNLARQKQKQTPLVPQKNGPVFLSQSDKQVLLKRQDDLMSRAALQISKLIAQKTEGRFGVPASQQQAAFVAPENADADPSLHEQQQFKIWQIVVDEETGLPAFHNKITGARMSKKPVGLILADEQEQLIGRIKLQAAKRVKVDPMQQGVIGQWQQVVEEQAYRMLTQQEFYQIPQVRAQREQPKEVPVQQLQKSINHIFKQAGTSGHSHNEARQLKRAILMTYDSVLPQRREEEPVVKGKLQQKGRVRPACKNIFTQEEQQF